MPVLVTGATGFVGSAVVRRLVAAGEEVRVLVRPESDRRNIAGLPVEIAVGDLTDPASLAAAVQGTETVFHVAADYRLWTPAPEALYAANVEGTRSILRAAAEAGVGRIVYTSSVATLGLCPDGTPADEETPSSLADMVGHYKRSKYLAEEEAQRMARAEGLPIVIVNPSTPIGPGDVKPTPTGRMIRDAVRGRIPAFVDTGLNLAHVDDVAEGHLLAWKHGRVGERYILGAENLTLRDLLGRISKLVGRRPPRLSLPHGLVLPVAYLAEIVSRATGGGEPLVTVEGVRLSRKRMFFTSRKAEAEIGYRPRPVDEAIADAVAWFARERA